MDRTVPSSGNEEIKLYMRTYYSLLRSSHAVQIKTLREAHKRMHSALHINADSPTPDMSAFIYGILRMPTCLWQVKQVVMGQSESVFAKHDYDVEKWQLVNAPGRRRRSFFDGNETLALYIASGSDIDDIIPILTAYQIEREKLHNLLNKKKAIALLQQVRDEDGGMLSGKRAKQLAELADISTDDVKKLGQVWGEETAVRLLDIAQREQQLSIRSLGGSLADYKRATRRWWQHVETALPHIIFDKRPVYFISSNTHSMNNLLTGFALQKERELNEFIHEEGESALLKEHHAIQEQFVPSNRANFLYYVLKKYEKARPEVVAERIAQEEASGIVRVPSEHAFDIEVQVVELSKLNLDYVDNRLHVDQLQKLKESNALIVNLDYPLGMAAYQVLSEIARNIDEIRGVYIMGKAATLNGSIGDVMVPSVVHDEHSLNTYLINNCFTAADVNPYLTYGTVMDNQKAITAPGTFLQNESHMSVFYNEGYTDLEMEAGPYLSCVYEMSRPKRHPYNELVNLYNLPFPIGILHYASDTPMSKGKNLGAQNLSYFGMDPTYATMTAVLRAILQTEIERL